MLSLREGPSIDTLDTGGWSNIPTGLQRGGALMLQTRADGDGNSDGCNACLGIITSTVVSAATALAPLDLSFQDALVWACKMKAIPCSDQAR